MACSSEKLAVKAEAPRNGAVMGTTAEAAAQAEAAITSAITAHAERYPDDETYFHPSITYNAPKAVRLAALLTASVQRGTPLTQSEINKAFGLTAASERW